MNGERDPKDDDQHRKDPSDADSDQPAEPEEKPEHPKLYINLGLAEALRYQEAWRRQFEPFVAIADSIMAEQRKLAASIAEFAMPRVNIPVLPPLAFEPVVLQQVQRWFNESYQPLIEASKRWAQLATPIISPELLETLKRLIERARPPNWPLDTTLDQVATLIEETGWPLIWVPRADIIQLLLDCSDQADREVLLLDRQAEVLDDVEAVLAQVPEGELRYLADCTLEAAAAARGRLYRAAQALAAATLTTVLQVQLGYHKFPDAVKELSEPWEEKSMWLGRWALITSTVPPALAQFWTKNGDPVPVRFNRHAVVHHVSPDQLTPLNALVGLMMVTALIRELHQLRLEGHL